MAWVNGAAAFTTEQAARQLNLNADTVKKWARRGYIGLDGQRHHLVVAGQDRRGVRLYRFDSLLKAEAATRLSGFSRRQPTAAAARELVNPRRSHRQALEAV